MPVKHAFTSAKSDGGDATLVRPSNWNADHLGNSMPVLVVAASDSPQKYKDGADYLCDGTADDVQLNSSLDDLPSTGGLVIWAPGTYAVSATVDITANKRVEIRAYGALLNLAASTTGLKVAQGISTARGVRLYGARIDGQSNATTVGVEFEDTNNSSLQDVEIENCTTGWLLDSQAASNFVEGSTGDNVLIRNCTTGFATSITSGTGSFMQTKIRAMKIVVGSSGTGISIVQNSLMLRAFIEASVWIGSSETAISLDGNMEDFEGDFAVEGEGGSTGNTGLVVGANCSNIASAWLKLKLTGTINTQVTNTGAEDFVYQPAANVWSLSQGTTVMGIRRHGDATDRLRFEALTAGPRISGGTGSAIDVNLYRSAADVWTSDDKVDPASLNLQVKAGTPADGDITGGAASGDIVLDTTNSLLYTRVGTTWTPINIPIISKGGTVLTPSGAINVIVWRAPFACTVTKVWGYRVGGTGATINARLNGSSNHLASALSVTSADTWMDGGSVQNTAYAAGDKLEIMVVSVTGSPTQVAIQVDFTRP